eukprot:8066416-Alexandrium_andersonii.AAC.1
MAPACWGCLWPGLGCWWRGRGRRPTRGWGWLVRRIQPGPGQGLPRAAGRALERLKAWPARGRALQPRRRG